MRKQMRIPALVMAVGMAAAACGDEVADDFGPTDPGPTEPEAEATTDTSETTVESQPTANAEKVLDQAALNDIAQQVIDQFELPGTAIQIRLDGNEPTTAVAGVANLETQQALTGKDQLRIYSVTKAVTAVIVLQLADEGILALDDPIVDWLPPSIIGGIPNSDQMTVRHLLNHSSGVADHHDTIRPGEQQPAFIGELFAQAQTGQYHWYTPQELIDFSTQFEPPFAPGEATGYSNTGYVILGLIVESATGNALEDEIETRVVEPLSLTSTYLETPATANDYAPGYQLVGEGQLLSVAGSNSSFAWAAGGLITNIHDLGRLTDAVFTGELLTPEAHETMFTFTPDPKNDIVEWGMGVYRLNTKWGPIDVAEGGAAGYSAIAFRFPEHEATIIGMFNRNDAAPAFELAVERSLELITP
ncbi:MAG: beta-lactamase family protein [bacterium]|nr:beta-lactamase family protein [bacterium]